MLEASAALRCCKSRSALWLKAEVFTTTALDEPMSEHDSKSYIKS